MKKILCWLGFHKWQEFRYYSTDTSQIKCRYCRKKRKKRGKSK